MGEPFRSVLIANRGEIAVRIIRACREANLRAIAMYSDADANALHVRSADEAHRLGPPPAAESYLRGDLIIAIAGESGAEAIHPGYGFLAENADFAQAVLDAGLVWIGPPPAAMRLLGDKAAAKSLAERVGVPTLPGYHGDAQDDGTLTAAAQRVGFPLLVKATAGGGGRGMRVVRAPAELSEALAAARREAQSAFGSDRLLLERYLESPRHVEMQILGDEHGNLLYLGERDCSVQRRHQKIIEEAPAPNFTEDQRRTMGDWSVALTRAAQYVNAGTVEYLLDREGRFYFLEVNTRLQVEHPVTELVTGLDLVQLQLRVAAGEQLPMQQSDLRIDGHAIESRLYAEDPEQGYLPSTGQLSELSWPRQIQVPVPLRIDVGYETGDVVTPHYDSLLAKLVSHSATRRGAISAQLGTLRALRVAGVRSNRRLLEAVLASSQFDVGSVHTGLLSELGLGLGPILPDDDLLIAAAVSQVLPPNEPEFPGFDRPNSTSVWGQVGLWRTGWVGCEIHFQWDERLISVGITPPVDAEADWRFRLPHGVVSALVELADRNQIVVEIDQRRSTVAVGRWARWPQMVEVAAFQRLAILRIASALGVAIPGRAHGQAQLQLVIQAPIPGRVARLLVKPGDRVKEHQTVAVLEAMKIEHLIAAPRDGVIQHIRVGEGDQVEVGTTLIELEDPS